jgi:hypothetical protein
MERHIETGRFSPDHYLEMWSKRIEDADIVAVVNEEVKKSDSVPRPTSKPSMTSLNRLKKAELVALAKERGVSHSGTKAQIIDAIREEEE